MSDFPEAHFDVVGNHPLDWRKAEVEIDPDDEELVNTPADVVALLGFDPKTET